MFTTKCQPLPQIFSFVKDREKEKKNKKQQVLEITQNYYITVRINKKPNDFVIWILGTSLGCNESIRHITKDQVQNTRIINALKKLVIFPGPQKWGQPSCVLEENIYLVPVLDFINLLLKNN